MKDAVPVVQECGGVLFQKWRASLQVWLGPRPAWCPFAAYGVHEELSAEHTSRLGRDLKHRQHPHLNPSTAPEAEHEMEGLRRGLATNGSSLTPREVGYWG